MSDVSVKRKEKPKAKIMKARNIIKVDADENGKPPLGLLARVARSAQQRRPKKPLNDLFLKLAEESTVDISQVRGPRICTGSPRIVSFGSPSWKPFSQVRKVYEAMESVLKSDLKEHGIFRLPAVATFSRKELPARPEISERMVCGKLVKVPARGATWKVKIAVSGQLKTALT